MVIPHTDNQEAAEDDGHAITAEDGIRMDGCARVWDDRRFTSDDELHDLLLGLTPDQAAGVLAGINDAAGARMALAHGSQERIARANARIEFAASRMLDGMRLEAEVSREAFDFWLGKQEELGANPWDFDEFWKEMLRDNPEMRVKTVSDRTTILSGFEAAAAPGEEAAA